jgi:hypothetical protein
VLGDGAEMKLAGPSLTRKKDDDMKKFLLATLAISALATAGAMATPNSSTFTGTFSASAFLNNGTVNVDVTIDDANLDCGTLNYGGTAGTVLAAGSACTSGHPIDTGTATVHNNSALRPFYVTLTDDISSIPNMVTLQNGADTFPLNLAVKIDLTDNYQTGQYFHPQQDTSTITITPTTGAQLDGNSPQHAGRYTGTFTFFLSF